MLDHFVWYLWYCVSSSLSNPCKCINWDVYLSIPILINQTWTYANCRKRVGSTPYWACSQTRLVYLYWFGSCNHTTGWFILLLGKNKALHDFFNLLLEDCKMSINKEFFVRFSWSWWFCKPRVGSTKCTSCKINNIR